MKKNAAVNIAEDAVMSATIDHELHITVLDSLIPSCDTTEKYLHALVKAREVNPSRAVRRRLRHFFAQRFGIRGSEISMSPLLVRSAVRMSVSGAAPDYIILQIQEWVQNHDRLS